MKMEESKPFEYMELKAMCMLCVAEVACMLALAQEGKFKDEVEGRVWVEKQVEKIINMRWNAPGKKIIVGKE